MKSRADLQHEVCMGAPLVAAADDIHGIRTRWERRAAEYDKVTRGELPADVEVFLNECLVAIPDTTDYPERLIAVVREQGRRIAELEATIKQMEEDDHNRRMEAMEYD